MPVLTRTTSSTSDAVAKPRRRWGVTAMEYLMMISLILVVCLIAIGYFGGNNSGNMSGSSNAINKAMKKGP